MTRRRYFAVCVACCFSFFVAGLSAQTLQIINADGHLTNITAAQIANLPHVTVEARDHDVPARFEGVRVSALLSTAGIQLGDTMHGPRMTEVLLVEAADGYKVVFAVTEFDPVFATREIVLTASEMGKHWTLRKARSASWHPAIKPARWIRQVTTMKLIAVK
jgi:hypothetical protein